MLPLCGLGYCPVAETPLNGVSGTERLGHHLSMCFSSTSCIFAGHAPVTTRCLPLVDLDFFGRVLLGGVVVVLQICIQVFNETCR